MSPSLSSDGYRIAEVCRNGHVSTSNAETYPDRREKFCSKCGEVTITHCSGCELAIRGSYIRHGMQFAGPQISHDRYTAPAYCFNCGSAFEWTNRKISGAVELVEVGAGVTSGELEQFQTDLTDATRDTPRTQVASLRIRQLMAKVGTGVAGGVKDIIVDLVSETAKKIIWGPGA